MEHRELYRLLEKYQRGETSIEEEKQLMASMDRADLPDELRADQALFQFYQTARKEQLANQDFEANLLAEIEHQEKASNRWMGWGLGMAATLLLAVGIWQYMSPVAAPEQAVVYSELQEQKEAMRQARAALMLMSSKLNLGTSSMQELQQFHQTEKEIKKKLIP